MLKRVPATGNIGNSRGTTWGLSRPQAGIRPGFGPALQALPRTGTGLSGRAYPAYCRTGRGSRQVSRVMSAPSEASFRSRAS